MAKKLVSPGVLTNEIDASFLPAALGAIGAAVVGPTSKGPILIPTIIENKNQLEATFGGLFTSGSNRYEYMTTMLAKKILQTKGPVTIVRVAAGTPTAAANTSLTQAQVKNHLIGSDNATRTEDSGSILSSTDPTVIGDGVGVKATGSFTIAGGTYSSGTTAQSMSIGSVSFVVTGSDYDHHGLGDINTATKVFIESGSDVGTTAGNFRDIINKSGSVHGLSISASINGGIVGLTSSYAGNYSAGVHTNKWFATSGGTDSFTDNLFMVSSSKTLFTSVNQIENGRDNDAHLTIPFKLHALVEGSVLNSRDTGSGDTLRDNGTLKLGTAENFRWEISDVDTTVGTFAVNIRAGNDSHKRKIVLEKFQNLSLDPTRPNYIGKVIGTQTTELQGSGTSEPYVKQSGDYLNKSKFVRVEVLKDLPNYLDENGNLTKGEYSASLPAAGSGSLGGGFSGGGDGTKQSPINFYETIEATNTQGLNPTAALSGKTAYLDAINLLANQDEYDINLLYMPGIIAANHGEVVTRALEMCEDRGDCFAVIDPVFYDSTVSQASTQGTIYNSSYGGMYWPWIQVEDAAGMSRFVPGSIGVAEVFAFNDKTKHPWFAPAGLNRGKINAIQTEQKLRLTQRDTLYNNRINPIATFPGQGVCVWGQKTLQKKSSALDRVNVRRLLIAVKKFIAASSRFLLFEQNTPALRKEFLAIANPYLEKVKSKSGLNAFKVVMDNTNNTPDTIDRNQLIGHIFLQPTKAAEFITIDFVLQRTGAEFSE